MRRWLLSVAENTYSLLTFWKKAVEIEAVTLPLNGLSPKVKFQIARGYEAAETTLIRRHVSAEDGVLEVGSSIGFIAVFCSKIIGVSSYAMVEANPLLVTRLRDTFSANGIPMPPLFQCAVGPVDGSVSFGVSRDSFASSVLERPRQTDRYEVVQKTVPALIGELNFVPNTLIMDIEGGEFRIPASHLADFKKMIIEVHPHFTQRHTHDRWLSDIVDLGFKQIDQEGRVYVFSR